LGEEMKRIFYYGLLICLILCSESHAGTYKIASLSWIGFSPADVAEAKGFWKDQGIDVKIVQCADFQEIDSLFSDGLVDIGLELIGTMVELYMDGVPLTIVGVIDRSLTGDSILSKKDITPLSLKGKPVGSYLNNISLKYFLNQYLMTIGLKLPDVRFTEMEAETLTDEFIADRFRMIVSIDTEAARAEKEGNGRTVYSGADCKGCISDGMMILKDTLKNMPKEDLGKIFKGWIKAIAWIKDPVNRNSYSDILRSYTFRDWGPYSEEDFRKMAQTAEILDAKSLMDENRDGGGLQTYLKNLKSFLSENHLLKKDFSIEELFDNKGLVEALK
jgi:NitT/TauT family transport system substrate-binding protein